MTNGEKMRIVFPDIEMWGKSKDTLDYSLGGMIHRVTKSWWNAEYKEPTTKNDLSSELEKNSKKLEKDFGESDCISRKSVIMIIQNHWWNCRDIDKLVNELPPVTPQPRKGNWVDIKYHRYYNNGDIETTELMCSRCREIVEWNIESLHKPYYCENYGADMRDEEV